MVCRRSTTICGDLVGVVEQPEQRALLAVHDVGDGARRADQPAQLVVAAGDRLRHLRDALQRLAVRGRVAVQAGRERVDRAGQRLVVQALHRVVGVDLELVDRVRRLRAARAGWCRRRRGCHRARDEVEVVLPEDRGQLHRGPGLAADRDVLGGGEADQDDAAVQADAGHLADVDAGDADGVTLGDAGGVGELGGVGVLVRQQSPGGDGHQHHDDGEVDPRPPSAQHARPAHWHALVLPPACRPSMVRPVGGAEAQRADVGVQPGAVAHRPRVGVQQPRGAAQPAGEEVGLLVHQPGQRVDLGDVLGQRHPRATGQAVHGAAQSRHAVQRRPDLLAVAGQAVSERAELADQLAEVLAVRGGRLHHHRHVGDHATDRLVARGEVAGELGGLGDEVVDAWGPAPAAPR